MRKYIFLLVAFLATAIAYAQKDNLSITSKIDKVTIFLQGAQVERTAQQALKPGKYNIVFPGISSRVDKQSIQLKAEGKLTVLSVTHQLNFLKEQQVQDDIKQLETQKEQLADRIAMEKNIQNVYLQEEQMILKNQSIKGDATLKAADLKEAADFQRQRLTEVYQKLQESGHTLKRLEGDLTRMNRQLMELNQKKDLSTSEVIAAVDVKENTSGSFRLTYLVKQSSWYPSYDIRVQDITQPVTLLMKANVQQQSGEDWKDVKLLLSTGNPNEEGTKPVLNPWYLRYYYAPIAASNLIYGSQAVATPGMPGTSISGIVRDDKGMAVAGATISVKGTTTATAADNNGNFSIQLPPNGNVLVVSAVGYTTQEIRPVGGYVTAVLNTSANALNEVVIIGYGSANSDAYDTWPAEKTYRKKKEATAINTTTVYQPTTTIYEIEVPYTVPNDGKMYTVDINHYEVDALYEYYAVPKLDPSAFLTARIIDWQDLNLFPGEANLFFEGTYLGNSMLDLQNAGDTLNLSLGRDKGVVVKRTLMKEFSSKKFLGSNKTDNRQYEIVVRNNKQQPIRITVEDQFPVSTQKDIEVEKLSYENAKLDDDTKKITWAISLDPKKEAKLQMGYVVKYPRDKTLKLD